MVSVKQCSPIYFLLTDYSFKSFLKLGENSSDPALSYKKKLCGVIDNAEFLRYANISAKSKRYANISAKSKPCAKIHPHMNNGPRWARIMTRVKNLVTLSLYSKYAKQQHTSTKSTNARRPTADERKGCVIRCCLLAAWRFSTF